jgi:hypothetical protein
VLTQWAEPRVIRLSLKQKPRYLTVGRRRGLEHYAVAASPAVPAMMHTCHEAKQVASKVYQRAFADSLQHLVYFNFARDTIYSELNMIAAFSRNESAAATEMTGRIRRMMISMSGPEHLYEDCGIMWRDYRAFVLPVPYQPYFYCTQPLKPPIFLGYCPESTL